MVATLGMLANIMKIVRKKEKMKVKKAGQASFYKRQLYCNAAPNYAGVF